MKKIDYPLLIHRTKYSFEKTTRKRKGTVIGPSYTEKGEKETKITDALSLHTIPYDRTPFVREIKYCIQLMTRLRNTKCDIVHLNSHLQISALPVLLITSMKKIPLVITIHGVYQETNLVVDIIQKVYLHTFCRLLWIKANAVVCLTEADAREIARYGCPKMKISIIPNWVNLELFRPKQNRKQNKIIWVGRFVPPKGLEYLVEAAKIVINSQLPCEFVLVGDGPLKPQIFKMISDENLSDSFELKDHMPNNVVAEEMADSSILVFPSLKEGMPFSVLEAASSGLAIVASDIPSMRAIFDDGINALLVKPKDPVALAEAITKLLQSEELRTKLQKEARKLMETNYSVDVLVSKTLDLYESILKK